MPKPNHSTRSWLTSSRKDKWELRMIPRLELKFWVKSTIGRRMMPSEFGVSDQRTLEETSWLIRLQEFNTWTNWENPWNLPGNGQPKKDHSAKRTWEESESILLTACYTLMPSTEEVVKSSQLPEDSTMHANWLPNQDSKSLSSWLKSLPQLTPWEEYITAWTPEEESSPKKNKLPEPHWTWYGNKINIF